MTRFAAAGAALATLVLVAGCSLDRNGINGTGVRGAEVGDGAVRDGVVRDGGTGGAAGTGGKIGGGGGATGGAGPSTGGAGGEIDAPVDGNRDVLNQPLGNGALCEVAGACASGACVDGVCCENSCIGTCMACTRDKTGEVDGQCRTVKAGSDPDSECEPDPGTPCGRTGRCGGGTCELVAAGKICGEASCSGNLLTPPPNCDGAGRCAAGDPAPCGGLLKCGSAKSCANSCTTSADCAGTNICDAATGTCHVGLPAGQACDAALAGKDCESGFCVDGVCCESACGGSCRACSLAKTGLRNGRCGPVKVDTDPDAECATDDKSTCGKTGACDGIGACQRYADGTTCGAACCTTNQGPGRGSRPCAFLCRDGRCETTQPVPTADACGGLTCCCPNGAGTNQPACVLPLACPGGNCQ